MSFLMAVDPSGKGYISNRSSFIIALLIVCVIDYLYAVKFFWGCSQGQSCILHSPEFYSPKAKITIF